MTEAVFQAPKRRARVYESYEGPFPVPLSAAGPQVQEPLVFRADMVNRHVVVRDPVHIEALYGKGYFGKGILSRSRPQHSASHRWHSESVCLITMLSTRYEQYVSWARDMLLSQGLEEDVVTEMLEKCAQPEQMGTVRDFKEDGQKEVKCSTETSTSPGPLPPCPHSSSDGDPECYTLHRQGDPQYDPLAKLYPKEPDEPTDQETLRGTYCSRHDDWVVHCGCQPDCSLLQTDQKGPSLSAGCQYVLVEEEEEGTDQAGVEINRHSSVRLVCRINPFRMIEYLQLSLEEAFFLVYALGCLSVYYNEKPLTIASLWEMFCLAQPNFDMTYAAYHYFRSKGWVPKTGLKYGTDFLLYRKGPPFYHASYSVVVEKVNDSFQGATLHPFTWRSLAALNRITGNVSKELMLCYVISPSDMSPEERRSPECLKRVRVQEVIVSRWVSSRERSEQEEI
ncbi:tRNA-splicing endonuclease subunit Sen2 isoform X4 [Arapaima gigas]